MRSNTAPVENEQSLPLRQLNMAATSSSVPKHAQGQKVQNISLISFWSCGNDLAPGAWVGLLGPGLIFGSGHHNGAVVLSIGWERFVDQPGW